jgi:hypothetical protein
MLLGVYRSCSFLRKAMMLLLKSGHEVGNPYTAVKAAQVRSHATRSGYFTYAGVYLGPTGTHLRFV